MMRWKFLCVVCLLAGPSRAQSFRYAAADVAGAKQQASVSLRYQVDYGMGQHDKLRVGWGIRFTHYTAKDRYYITAPAKLTSGSTGPLVIFKTNLVNNIDSLLLPTTQVTACNVFITLGYQLSAQWAVAFNIDAVGVSFGPRRAGRYIQQAGDPGTPTDARPTRWNALLISDNDYGTLNSQLLVRYHHTTRWSLHGGAQFLFSEYTTTTAIQQQPAPNDRFRYKAVMLMVGVSWLMP